jgi:hypothetical protein
VLLEIIGDHGMRPSLVAAAVMAALTLAACTHSASSPHAGSQPPKAISSCPSAAAVRQILETQIYWRHTAFTLSPDVTCIGPYVVAAASNSSGSGARVLLKQEPTGLRYLVAGSGPICTIIRSDAEPGQLVYIPPQYGHALLCLNGNGLA